MKATITLSQIYSNNLLTIRTACETKLASKFREDEGFFYSTKQTAKLTVIL